MEMMKIVMIIVALLIALSLFQTFQLIGIQNKISTTGYAVKTQPTETATPLPRQRGGC
jgi:hypothetical protein